MIDSLESLLSIFICFVCNYEALIIQDHQCNTWSLKAIDEEQSNEEIMLFIDEEETQYEEH